MFNPFSTLLFRFGLFLSKTNVFESDSGDSPFAVNLDFCTPKAGMARCGAQSTSQGLFRDGIEPPPLFCDTGECVIVH
jgi:hypothetical protein